MPDLIDYLEATVAKGGSDLHIASGTPAYARINGDLVKLEDEILDANPPATSSTPS